MSQVRSSSIEKSSLTHFALKMKPPTSYCGLQSPASPTNLNPHPSSSCSFCNISNSFWVQHICTCCFTLWKVFVLWLVFCVGLILWSLRSPLQETCPPARQTFHVYLSRAAPPPHSLSCPLFVSFIVWMICKSWVVQVSSALGAQGQVRTRHSALSEEKSVFFTGSWGVRWP